MMWTRVAALVLALTAVAGCSGGGSSTPAPGAAWQKFRQDFGNSGRGLGSARANAGTVMWSMSIDPAPSGSTDPTPSAVSASPAIALKGTILVGSEGGYLAALYPVDGSIYWRVNSCAACLPTPTQTPGAGAAATPAADNLGPLMSSPAVFTSVTTTSVFVASKTGTVYGFQFDDNTLIFDSTRSTPPTCTMCFRPTDSDSTISASFLSSPTFTFDTVSSTMSNVAAVFIGATLNAESDSPSGKLYALNTDGSVQWEYPGPGDETIQPITSSPALDLPDSLYFTTNDGWLYALTPEGDFKWKTPFTSSSDGGIAPSPLVNGDSVIANASDGEILALNTDGSFQWRRTSNPNNAPNDGLAGSLAVGAPVDTPTGTPTSTPARTPTFTPTPTGTIYPTLTPTAPVAREVVVAVSKLGTITLFEANPFSKAVTPQPDQVLPTPVATIASCTTQLCSSPALSNDGYVVIGDSDGKLHVVHTLDGSEPNQFPVALLPKTPPPNPTPQPIRSSPSIGSDGTIYVGSDDGMLYAIGPTLGPTSTPTFTPLPTRTPTA